MPVTPTHTGHCQHNSGPGRESPAETVSVSTEPEVQGLQALPVPQAPPSCCTPTQACTPLSEHILLAQLARLPWEALHCPEIAFSHRAPVSSGLLQSLLTGSVSSYCHITTFLC